MNVGPYPFTVNVPRDVLDDIRFRLERSRISYAPCDDEGWKYGVDSKYLGEFRDYWLKEYDWRQEEKKLNAYPQFVADIEGLRIHFYHVLGEGPDPYPLILTHGWPGSVVEFLEVIPLLVAQGYTVVVPSLPGYGFSQRPSRPIGTQRVADLWRKLMTEVLGYARFGAQGGDWGAFVSRALGQRHSDVVGAIHLNMIYPEADLQKHPELSEWFDIASKIQFRELAYYDLQREKPQTIGTALSDTPLGFAGWVLEKNQRWSEAMESTFTKADLITNIMTYLVNDAVTSAAWMYHGYVAEGPDWTPVKVPTGFAEFPGEFIPAPPRVIVEREFNLQRWTRMEKGGHFGAWEQPALFAAEVGEFFRNWR